jgi:cyclopropane-fatty-acyl-phospholipid synthase
MANVTKFEEAARQLLALAEIKINGSNPWDIIVHNDKFYEVVLSRANFGLGESYMDGWWDCEMPDEFFARLIRAQIPGKIKKNSYLISQVLLARMMNRQSRKRAFQVGERHYDLGNELFINMLDKHLVYSCAYWQNARTVDDAQENKLELICRKLNLQAGMKVLDIGCGWGGFAKYAAERYQAKVVGITVSKEQVELAQTLCAGLPIEIRLQDYRDVNEKFDRIVSVGMIEHVGYKNYRSYMEVARRCMENDGLFLLHTIGGNRSVKSVDPWMNRYIFPNGMLPSIKQLGQAIEGLFVMEDWHNFSADYDKTLMAWHGNLEKNWDELSSKYDEKFHRMWRYYLLSCAGSFRARSNQLWQIVLSPSGVTGGYESIR